MDRPALQRSQVRGVAELLIDLETNPAARAFAIGMLRETDRR
jgi:hypothetical protein